MPDHKNGDILSDGTKIVRWTSGTLFYVKDHKLNYLFGPAEIHENGGKYWWINNHNVTDKIHQWAKEMNIDLDNLSDEDKFMIRLYWENYDGE